MGNWRKRIRAWGSLGVILAILLSMAPAVPAGAAGGAKDTAAPKLINVVYDDSTSMGDDGSDRWCKAKYALEVFAAMMGEKDTMNVFMMSDYDPEHGGKLYEQYISGGGKTSGKPSFTVQGSDGNRVNTVERSTNTTYQWTPIESVEVAAEALKKAKVEDAKTEKWLVVLTDGDRFFRYNEASGKDEGLADSPKTLGTLLNGYAGSDYNIIYLGIGTTPAVPKSTSGHFSVRTASDANILTQVTEIANTIFGYQKLPKEYIDHSGDTYTLKIDIPTTQLIVFGQGPSIAMGSVVQEKELKGTELPVRYSSTIPQGSFKGTGPKVDENLNGIVATYKRDADNPFPGKDFNVSVSGESQIEFYYKPGVSARCQLWNKDSGEAVTPGTSIEAGLYQYKVGFFDKDNNEIKSNLLQYEDKPHSLQVEEDGKELITTEDLNGEFEINEGRIDLKIHIELGGDVALDETETYQVGPKRAIFRVEIKAQGEYKAHMLGDSAEPILVTIIDDRTGQPITAEQWAGVEDPKVKGLKDVPGAMDSKLLEWEWKKGASPGTYEIRPYPKNDKAVSKLEAGQYWFSVELEGEINGQKIEFLPEQSNDFIIISAYTGTDIVFVAENPEKPVSVDDFETFPGILVTAYIVDDDTGQQVLLPEDAWNEISVKPTRESTKRIRWKIEKGETVGTYRIHPGIWVVKPFSRGAAGTSEKEIEQQKAQGKNPGPVRITDLDVQFIGRGSVGPMIYQGEGSAHMQDTPMSYFWIMLILAIIAIIIIAALLWGYLGKKKIDKSAMRPRIVYGDLPPMPKKVRIIPWTKYLPFVSQRGIICCSHPSFCNVPNVKIKAEGYQVFSIINVDAFMRGNVIIAEDPINPGERDELAAMVYSYDEFTIQEVPQQRGTLVGKFYLGKNSN